MARMRDMASLGLGMEWYGLMRSGDPSGNWAYPMSLHLRGWMPFTTSSVQRMIPFMA